MRRSFPVAAVLALLAGALHAQLREPPPQARFDWFSYEGQDSIYRIVQAGPGQYLNPILAGFYPDPTICRQGEDYYLSTSSFTYYPGVPLFTSKDLVHWTQLGHILTRPSQLNVDSAATSRGIFAPALSCRPGKLWMITTLVDRLGNFLVTTTDPAGPWSEPVQLNFDGIDPSLFFDDDGKIYIVHNGLPDGPQLYGQGHRAIWIQEYDSTSHRMVGPHTMIVNGGVDLARHPIWIEAPHVFRKDGWYYLICAEGGTADQHSEVVFRSQSVFGPYVPGPINPILTQRHLGENRPFPVTSTGHAEFVETQNGEWYAVFLGTRPYATDTYNIGRETFMLPVTWQDGWPMILPASDTLPYVARAPNLLRDPRPGTTLNGNFTDRDDFNGPDLRPTWMFMRTVRESWYDFTSMRGFLSMRARDATLESHGQPSFIGRRQQHLNATASTAMRFAPALSGDKAGLTAFQSSDAWFLLSVALDSSGRRAVVLEQRSGRGAQAATAPIASARLAGRADATVYLRIVARAGRYDFYYATRPDAWTLLKGDADGTILSTKVAGGFVGTLFGLYAHHPGM